MITISTREQLAKMVDKHKNLTIDDDVLIEFSLTMYDIRDVRCRDLTLKKNIVLLDFNGRNFTGGAFDGGDFNGGDFNGGDFNGGDFTGGNFNGGDFNGWNFTGWNISYHAFFCCYGRIIKHGKIEARHPKAHLPIELGKEQEDK